VGENKGSQKISWPEIPPTTGARRDHLGNNPKYILKKRRKVHPQKKGDRCRGNAKKMCPSKRGNVRKRKKKKLGGGGRGNEEVPIIVRTDPEKNFNRKTQQRPKYQKREFVIGMVVAMKKLEVEAR